MDSEHSDEPASGQFRNSSGLEKTPHRLLGYCNFGMQKSLSCDPNAKCVIFVLNVGFRIFLSSMIRTL